MYLGLETWDIFGTEAISDSFLPIQNIMSVLYLESSQLYISISLSRIWNAIYIWDLDIYLKS